MGKSFLTIIGLCLLITVQGADALWKEAAGGIIAAGVAAVGLPAALGVVGFTGAGIAAGSYAAGMMSSAAVAGGGGVATGGVVAVCQSIGAAGLASSTSAAIGAGGAALAGLIRWLR